MLGNNNDVPKEEKQKIDEIYLEIQKLMEGKKDLEALSRNGALPPRLKGLIALASAIATQQKVTTASCVAECLKTGASREEIMEVLRLAILIAEVPVKLYDTIVRDAINSFDNHN